MGVVLFGVWAGGLLGAGVGLLSIRFIQRLGYSRQLANWLGIIAMTVSMALFVPALTCGLISVITIDRIGVNPPESDRMLAHWKVPPGAVTDLCYYRSARLSENFDFQIS